MQNNNFIRNKELLPNQVCNYELKQNIQDSENEGLDEERTFELNEENSYKLNGIDNSISNISKS